MLYDHYLAQSFIYTNRCNLLSDMNFAFAPSRLFFLAFRLLLTVYKNENTFTPSKILMHSPIRESCSKSQRLTEFNLLYSAHSENNLSFRDRIVFLEPTLSRLVQQPVFQVTGAIERLNTLKQQVQHNLNWSAVVRSARLLENILLGDSNISHVPSLRTLGLSEHFIEVA